MTLLYQILYLSRKDLTSMINEKLHSTISQRYRAIYIAREACAYANPVALYVTLKGLNYNIGI